MIKQTPIEKIISIYDAQLVVPDKATTPFILCPVGQVGAGKTTVTKPLAERFSLVRISSDEIRKILKEGQYDYIQEEIRVIEFTLLRKYLELGHGVAYDTNCSTKTTLIDKLQEKFNIPTIWLYINPPEEFIINKLKKFEHTFLFKDAEQAVHTYFKDKINFDNFDRPFLYTFDTSKENIELQITEAGKLIVESLRSSKLHKIKPLSFEDLPYVSGIMQKRWGVSSEWADEETKRFLVADRNTAGFCVYENNKTVGVGLFDLHNDDVSKDYGPWLYLLWVDLEHRGHNLGIELTKKRMDHARKYGYKEVYLDTTDALEYHKKLGWEEVCVVDYEGEIDHIMKYDLSKNFPK